MSEDRTWTLWVCARCGSPMEGPPVWIAVLLFIGLVAAGLMMPEGDR